MLRETLSSVHIGNSLVRGAHVKVMGLHLMILDEIKTS